MSQGIDTTTAGVRLFFHVLAAIADLEHDLIVEWTMDGLAAARARGRKGGPNFKMTPNRIQQARAMCDTGEYTVQEIADTFAFHGRRSTVTLAAFVSWLRPSSTGSPILVRVATSTRSLAGISCGSSVTGRNVNRFPPGRSSAPSSPPRSRSTSSTG